MSKTIPRAVPDTYLELIRKFPLRSIRNDSELDAAQAVLESLLRRQLGQGGEQYFGVLTDLIEVYENKAHPIPDASEAEVLRMLMESNGLSQARLARQVGISQSTISAVLAESRSLTKEQIVVLARYFCVSPAAFLPTDESAAKKDARLFRAGQRDGSRQRFTLHHSNQYRSTEQGTTDS